MARKQSDALRIVILVVWIAGFVVGTTTHVVDLVVGGAEAYAGFPLGVRVFWMSLTLLDPITVVLLALRRRAGIVLALVVILADIAVNWTVFASNGIPLFGVVNQTLFAIVLVSTAPVLWRWFGQK
ncbi:hypothetical protein MUN74_09590 [Agromyces endophyticus]|uniref:hypothetical protein n=1 Tax=Agromyces sp. H17E-10 TaxID=2932244 RepID=UPI001FD27F5E|nr:hypothetical protein [Agromyces sp. H17E-10]UOQ91118.1 hypothetical protein MUN74_09590 [Agromyces sp. H17E-10]